MRAFVATLVIDAAEPHRKADRSELVEATQHACQIEPGMILVILPKVLENPSNSGVTIVGKLGSLVKVT